MYQERTYRNLVDTNHETVFRVGVKETDLWIHAPSDLENIAKELILEHRGYIESYIRKHPEFSQTLIPWQNTSPVPLIIQDMITASQKARVGPMAAVAGAIAEYVGKGLIKHSDEVVVENGGDIFLKTKKPATVAIFAGESPLSLRIGLRAESENKSLGICTSSGTVGHSLSMGKADAVCVVSESCSLADAAATSVGNHVKSHTDIEYAVHFGKSIPGVIGLVIIIGDKIGMWGKLEIIPLKRKKG
jgi:ApbE superfamily uncharacterized protein (UPF0280 family)